MIDITVCTIAAYLSVPSVISCGIDDGHSSQIMGEDCSLLASLL